MRLVTGGLRGCISKIRWMKIWERELRKFAWGWQRIRRWSEDDHFWSQALMNHFFGFVSWACHPAALRVSIWQSDCHSLWVTLGDSLWPLHPFKEEHHHKKEHYADVDRHERTENEKRLTECYSDHFEGRGSWLINETCWDDFWKWPVGRICRKNFLTSKMTRIWIKKRPMYSKVDEVTVKIRDFEFKFLDQVWIR